MDPSQTRDGLNPRCPNCCLIVGTTAWLFPLSLGVRVWVPPVGSGVLPAV